MVSVVGERVSGRICNLVLWMFAIGSIEHPKVAHMATNLIEETLKPPKTIRMCISYPNRRRTYTHLRGKRGHFANEAFGFGLWVAK